tara:strand:+ start:1197 stop:2003 length:807 start_codon:yes stop_codon:yes gene_type:complete
MQTPPLIALGTSLAGPCNKTTLPQDGGLCYAVAALVLAAKVPAVRSQLDGDALAFIKMLEEARLRSAAAVSEVSCTRAPSSIAELYRRFAPDGLVEFGYATPLLVSILNGSSIPARYVAYDSPTRPEWFVAGGINLKFEYILQTQGGRLLWEREPTDDVPNQLLVLEFAPPQEGMPGLDQSRQTRSSARLGVQDWRDVVDDPRTSKRLLGGILGLTAVYGKTRMDHDVAFTMCNGKMLLCNWGDCTFELTRTDIFTIENITLLFGPGV